MFLSHIAVTVLVSASCVRTEADLLTDITKISGNWGQISPYTDNTDDYFGVDYVGLPSGCQIESVSTLQRHAQRFQTSALDDGANDQLFVRKLANFTTSQNSTGSFSGPLSFLNTYRYPLRDSGLLTGLGAATEFTAGVTFWNRYGRILYNASIAQLGHNASYPNGAERAPVVLRTTGQSRIENSQINWALGFFGPSFEATPNPTLANATSPFEVVTIPEGGIENNTLASYDSCFNDNNALGSLGDDNLFIYIPKYLGPATARLQKFAPQGFTLNVNETYAMQSICAYENTYFGMSDFCGLFTAEEWAGFENTLDIEYFYDYAYGNPTGRAQGIGYVQELIARLTDTYITSSNSSVNSTLDDNPETFPLGQKFFADFTHDDIIISVLTALSMDYFRDPPSLTQFPPNPNRRFILNKLTPFGGRLITETIGCAVSDPNPIKGFRVQYTPDIRGGSCGDATTGRIDGMCEIGAFLESQANSYALSNYNYACFGNYTVANPTNGYDYDGTIWPEM